MTAAGQPGQRQREQVPPAATPAQGIPLIVDRGGRIHTVYDERIDLTRIGALSIRRGSYVEPTPTGQWTADLAPCDGPLLGPFASRGDAIAAELAWLVEHWLDSVTGSLGTLPERR